MKLKTLKDLGVSANIVKSPINENKLAIAFSKTGENDNWIHKEDLKKVLKEWLEELEKNPKEWMCEDNCPNVCDSLKQWIRNFGNLEEDNVTI